MPTINDLIKNARSVVLLNALPLNAFNRPVRLDVIPIDNNDALNVVNILKNSSASVKCFIGHAPTASLLTSLGLNVSCTRGMWSFNNDTDLIIAIVLKSRPATSGADVTVTLNDLLFYIIVPSPISP